MASLEARLEATIRKYETQMHTLHTENERLRSHATPLTNGKIKLSLCLHYTGYIVFKATRKALTYSMNSNDTELASLHTQTTSSFSFFLVHRP